MLRNISNLDDGCYDLLVCGGGIYGAWTAYDATLRGLKVALVEKQDWAGGTSSASSKLIHGGLRYLEFFEIRLVRKTLAERQMLLATAPHRVWPLRFGIPAYASNRVGNWRIKLGLMLYDALAGIGATQYKHKSFGKQAFIEAFPYLKSENLIKGFSYVDAQTDDARFVLEIVAGALEAGAHCSNYCSVEKIVCNDGRISGAQLIDQVSGKQLSIECRHVVNTTGQWSDSLVPGENLKYRMTKGVHLVMPGLGVDEALLIMAKSDGRVFFLIPWYGKTLLGTTDTDYSGDLENVRPEPADIQYLLSEVNQVFGRTHWTQADILGAYAGLRVMREVSSDSPSDVSREWHLEQAATGALYSIGGKYTSARQDASRIVDRICADLSIEKTDSTDGRAFPWSPDGEYSHWKMQMQKRGEALGVDSESAHWLFFRHGKNVEKVYTLVEANHGSEQRLFADVPFIKADLLHCAESEMVVCLEDLLRRRLPLVILRRMAKPELHSLARLVADELGWDSARIDQEVSDCSEKWSKHH